MRPIVLVLAPYPNEKNINDGFIQRVKKMDEFMAGNKRVYIQVSLRKFLKKETIKYDEEVLAYRINFILHWYILLKYAIISKIIYAHTIYNLVWLSYFFPLLKKPIILDVHGTVPEEKLLAGDRSGFKRYEKVEKRCFEKISHAIHVTESMRRHFSSKYDAFQYKNINYGIIPDHINEVNRNVSDEAMNQLRTKLNIGCDDVVVVYSGGLHAWQKIDVMLKTVEQKENDENVVYIFLTNNKDAFRDKIEQNVGSSKRIFLDSVHPSELKNYYAIGHYGFILRDDTVVNKVANPTKLIEYLYYGMIPIVDFVEIGDFAEYRYVYLHKNQFCNSRLAPRKSLENKKVVDEIFNSYNQSEITKLFKTLNL